jgi:hypothetical protein
VALLRAANLAVKFLLELGAIGALAYWGASSDAGIASPLLALAAPGIAIAAWATFAAPRSRRRLSERQRIPFELAVFGLAALALAAAVGEAWGIVFAAVVALNAGLLVTLGDSER